ncbi:MAG: LysR family transcriptional regulator [Myxococcota bacterium]
MDRLERMEIFVRVVEAGSLTAAARTLGVSLPTASRALANLEEELGVELVRRSTRRAVATEAGRRYYEHCVGIAEAVERARVSVVPDEAAQASLVVSAPVTLGLTYVAPVVREMLEQFVRLRIDLRLEERRSDFIRDGVDVAIRAGQVATSSTAFIARHLADSPRVLVASPTYLRCRTTPKRPADLAEHDLVTTLGSSGTAPLWRMHRGGREHVVGVRGRLRCGTLLALRDAAVEGAGITMLPRRFVVDDLECGRLTQVLAAYEMDPIKVFAVYRTQARGTKIVRSFVERMRRALRPP